MTPATATGRCGTLPVPIQTFNSFNGQFRRVAAQQPQFSPKQVALALDVSESSLKRWCDNGAISSVKTVGGHRRIPLDSLQDFLRAQRRCLCRPDVLGLPPLIPSRSMELIGREEPLHKEFRGSMATGDEVNCRRLLHLLIDRGASPAEAAESLITDAMRGIGAAWKNNELSIYQERRGCDIALRLIYELRGTFALPRPDALVAIGGALEGDPYQLPTALIELALREVGWNATSLGTNLPVDTFAQAISDYRPAMVWLSVSAANEPDWLVAAEQRLAATLADDVPLLVGGRAICERLRPRLQYTANCQSIRELVDMAIQMTP